MRVVNIIMCTVAVSCCRRGRLFLSALGFAGSPQVGGPTRLFIPYFSIFKNGFWGVAISEGQFSKKRPPALRGPYPPTPSHWVAVDYPGAARYPLPLPVPLRPGGWVALVSWPWLPVWEWDYCAVKRPWCPLCLGPQWFRAAVPPGSATDVQQPAISGVFSPRC